MGVKSKKKIEKQNFQDIFYLKWSKKPENNKKITYAKATKWSYVNYGDLGTKPTNNFCEDPVRMLSGNLITIKVLVRIT